MWVKCGIKKTNKKKVASSSVRTDTSDRLGSLCKYRRVFHIATPFHRKSDGTLVNRDKIFAPIPFACLSGFHRCRN